MHEPAGSPLRSPSDGPTADGKRRACVFTCMIGRYEKLNEQPVAAHSDVPFLCLTDDATLQSSTWRIVKVEPMFPQDPVRSQRILKLLPERFLPDVDVSLYIDNSIVLSRPPEEVFERYLTSCDFAVPTHSFRERVIDEFMTVAADELDDPARISEQLNHYRMTDPGVLDERPFSCGILLRRHGSDDVRRAFEVWAAHILRYSRRDQLSANAAFRQTGFGPHRIEIDNYSSWFHTWPHTPSRDVDRRKPRPEHWQPYPVERVRQLQADVAAHIHSLAAANRELATVTADYKTVRAQSALNAAQRDRHALEISAMTSSVSWRLTAPLRAFRKSWPRLARSAHLAERWLLRHGRAGQTSAAANANSSVRHGNGRIIHVDPKDERGQSLVRSGGSLNPISLAMWRLLLSEGDWTRVIDVGANYGEMLVGADLPRDAAVIAIEPNPDVAARLRRTMQDSDLAVEVLQLAASAESHNAVLYVDRTWSGLSSIAGVGAESAGHVMEAVPISAIPLASLLDARKRDDRPERLLLKIDVEGHEAAVIRGLGHWVDQAEDFAAMVEIIHTSVPDLDALLARFTVELYDPQANKLVPLAATTAAELHELLIGGTFYPQDAVVRRRPA